MKKTITHKEKIIFPNGKKYVGEFKDGARHGQGTFTFTDGSKDIGEFKDDEFIG
ncbi:MAG: hypothetical protein QGG38_07990 [Nitrospinaceae bacterium]|jgi:hypothetical protein|nr:hypothetical protein [Nitrospinaceae bacterium]|tara:strand:- start:117 stop:278 length:162 start_codon:yes stop_codon:yes gene_type:complete